MVPATQWARTVALDKVKAPSVKADGGAKPLEPGLEVVAHACVGVINVGSCYVILPSLVIALAAKGGVVAADGIDAPW